MIEIKILHTLCSLIFPLKCCFGTSDGISWKYLAMWVSFLVLDPDQNSGFGRGFWKKYFTRGLSVWLSVLASSSLVLLVHTTGEILFNITADNCRNLNFRFASNPNYNFGHWLKMTLKTFPYLLPKFLIQLTKKGIIIENKVLLKIEIFKKCH